MDGLRLRDLEAASSLLRDLYALRDLDQLRTHVLSALPRVVPADRISYNEVNPQARRNEYVSLPGVATVYEPAFLRHMGDHPLIAHYRATRDGRALRISDVLPRRRFRRLPLYHEFFRPLGVEHQIAVTLPAAPPLVVGVALSRGRADFSDRERRLLDLLRPHLVQAYRNAETVTRMREEHATAGKALEDLPYGVVVLADGYRVRMANQAAARLLGDCYGTPLGRGDRLPDDLELWVRRQSAPIDPGVPRGPLVIQRGRHDLVVRLAGGDGRWKILLVEERPVPSPHAIARLGLTRREADVMTWLVRGKSNAQIADILGVSTYTVIKHLQHVFAKLGVTSRTAAAARVLSGFIR